MPGARVVARNVLEWRADPASAWHDPALAAAAPLVLMCQEGYQSSLAAAVLLDIGVEATDVIGGFEAWRAAGLPVAGAGTTRTPRRTAQRRARRADRRSASSGMRASEAPAANARPPASAAPPTDAA